MKKYMILHFGFEQPTDEVMKEWNQWFESIKDRQLDQGGFMNGREISKSGLQELSWDSDCITGYNIIEAETIDEAVGLAQSNPFISSVRIYELR